MCVHRFWIIISLIMVDGFGSPNESWSCYQGQFDPAVDSWGNLVPDEKSDNSDSPQWKADNYAEVNRGLRSVGVVNVHPARFNPKTGARIPFTGCRAAKHATASRTWIAGGGRRWRVLLWSCLNTTSGFYQCGHSKWNSPPSLSRCFNHIIQLF